jgi:hypothetical protein
MAVQTHFQLNIKGVEEQQKSFQAARLRGVLAAAPLSACYKNIASALQLTSLPTFLDNNIPATSRTFLTMLATDSHSLKHSENARPRVKKERNKIDSGGK